MSQLSVVTGAFGYTGEYIARRLLSAGRPVRTLTAHPNRANGLGLDVEVAPLDFTRPEALVRSLRGADVLINTYWVRFNHGQSSFDDAVRNSRTLIYAAREAGIRKIVHVSIANPSLDSPLPYYAGKARVEDLVINSGLSYAILRPTVVFGAEGILINNIAWFVRHLPLFVVPGSGQYRVQPVFVEDLAELACDCAVRAENSVFDAVGPEIYSFEELVRTIAAATRSRTLLVHARPQLALWMIRLLQPLVGDVILTREEIGGLLGNLLVSKAPATGTTRFSEWLSRNASILGTTYLSELRMHYRQNLSTSQFRAVLPCST
jgi:NADH dehydrogenase